VGLTRQLCREQALVALGEESNFFILVDSERLERGARSSASPRAGPPGSRRRVQFFILVDSEPPERGAHSSASPRAGPHGSK
jgi:hypothetical protein